MVRALTGVARDGWQWCRWSPYLALLVALALGMAVVFCWRTHSDWESVYVPAAVRLRTGSDIFQQAYLYPPAFATLAVPFSYLPPLPGRLAWYIVNVVAVAVLVRGAWHLVGGRPFTRSGSWPWREHAVLLCGLAASVYYAADAFTNQQTDLVVAALCVGGCLMLRREQSLGAGLLFGMAAGLKCTPLLWAPYLALRGRWRAAGLVVAVAVVVNLLPDLLWQPLTDRPRLAEWVGRYLAPMGRADYDPGTWGSLIHFNHSLSGVANRWLTGVPEWSTGRLMTVACPERVSVGMLRGVVGGLALALIGLAFLAGRRADGRRHSVSEWSLVFLLMVLLSPMSSKPHFCVLVLPAFVLARRALVGDRVSAVFLLLAALSGLVSNKDLVGGWLYDRSIWAGSVFANTVFLYAGCCITLWQGRSVDPVGDLLAK